MEKVYYVISKTLTGKCFQNKSIIIIMLLELYIVLSWGR
jgi:hypothetical protein